MLKSFKKNQIPKVVFLGNGLNRVYGGTSWTELLEDITTVSLTNKQKEHIKTIPFPLQAVVLTNDQVQKGMDRFSGKMMQQEINENTLKLFDLFTTMPWDAILTTNYSYEIEKSFNRNFYCKMKSKSKYRFSTMKGNTAQEQFGLFKYMNTNGEENPIPIWHIHGEIARPKSLVFGHYFYGNIQAEIQKYISTFVKRYESCEKNDIKFQPKSWIDYFLLGDVHIIGYGLDVSEFDIWWLINLKKNLKSKLSGEIGKIYFYERKDTEESKYPVLALAKAYCVDVKLYKDNVYEKYYQHVAREVKKIF